MKVYLFNTHNGIFEGETFEEPDIVQYEEGMTPISPPEYEHGYVPIFDQKNNEWAVVPLTSVRELLNSNSSNPMERG
ncbi:MAG: hypothetical protein PHH28_10830 [Desulfuromonadaceae bacterium]|nr:hypothetical protein [Desulfuromonadaceae bacterium]